MLFNDKSIALIFPLGTTLILQIIFKKKRKREKKGREGG